MSLIDYMKRYLNEIQHILMNKIKTGFVGGDLLVY